MAVSCGSAGDDWRNEAFNRSVIDAVGANIAVLDRKGFIIAVNSQWEQFAADNGDLTGGARTGMGVNYLEVILNARGESQEGCSETLKGLRKILKGRSKEFVLEYPCHSPNRKRWFMLRATALQMPDRGAVVIHIDITERRLAEEALRQSELKYSLAESLAHIGHWERNYINNTSSWSPEIFRIFGIDPQGGPPNFRKIMDLVHPQDRDRLQREFDSIRFSAHKKKRPILIEYRIILRDGTERVLSTTVQPVHSSDGRSINLRGIVQDITDRRVLENRIAAISKAERKSLQRDLHDTVCQQLSGLAFLAEEIKQDLFKHPERAARDLEKIIQINQTALGQAKEVARGLTPLADAPAEALENALREMARFVSLTYRIPCRLIPPQRIFLLDSHTSTQLYLIAREAAVNAARHARGRLIRITLSYRGKFVTVRVIDDGRGLDPKQGGDQGLGLETMKQRADLINARLRIFPGKKRGTVVECRWEKGNRPLTETH